MPTYNTSSARLEALSDPINDSDEELFSIDWQKQHETVETVPLPRLPRSEVSDEEEDDSEYQRHETVATIPVPRPQPSASQQHDFSLARKMTQPTQLLPQASAHFPPSSPPSTARSHVQVTASSPVSASQRPAQYKPRPGGFLANAMTPAGTALRMPMYRPPPPPNPVVIDDDDDGPTYKGASSDDESLPNHSSNVKTTNFQRSAVVPESPIAGKFAAFSAFLKEFEHKQGVKRSGDDMASAYGSASKKSRQQAPSRAQPVRPTSPDMDLDEIDNPNVRVKITRMKQLVSDVTVKQCLKALETRKFHFDDALELLLTEKEKADSQESHQSIVISDDELTKTPAVQRKAKPFAAKQEARNAGRTIADKWSSTQQQQQQQQAKKEVRHLDAFSPPKESKPRKRLIRGSKNRSSPDLPDLDEEDKAAPVHAKIGKPIIVDDDSDDDGSGSDGSEDGATSPQLGRWLHFFNTCTVADLSDIANIKPSLAQHFVSLQPFTSLDAVSAVDDPERPHSKSRRTPVGEKILDKVSLMLDAYEAVDYLVKKCEALAKPLAEEMRKWGVNATGDGAGEVEMTSMQQSPSHDSGIGTPPDDEKPRLPSYITQPAIMNFEYRLTDYQVVGVNWLNLLYRKKLSCILADDMGLGKTYQVIAFLTHLFMTGKKGPHLIVVPAATLENWLMEFKKFSPLIKVEPYYETAPGKRAEMRFQMENAREKINVIVTTYNIAKAKDDAIWLRNFGFDCAIFDEGHVLKNASSLVSRKLSRIGAKFRLLLTGTPLQNNLKELISLLAFMQPDIFDERSEQLEAIFTHHVKTMDEDHDALLSTQRIARARSMLTPFILRRKKSQVAKDLPPKERKVEFCDLSPEQDEVYSHWLNKALEIRAKRERGLDCSTESTHILMKLRQAAIHPWLFRRLYQDRQLPKIAKQCLKDPQWAMSQPDLIVSELVHYSDMEVHTLCAKNPVLNKFALKNNEWLASGKVVKMLELLHAYMAEGSRTLIFSQFTMVLDILEVVLNHEMIRYFRLDGSTRVDQRQDLINTFSEDGNDTPVFMLSTKAGGAGINLAAANKVIIFDSGFNPQDDIQAENRAHRIGQTKPVEVVRLVSKGTVEEAIYKMGLTKVELDQRVAGVASGTATPAEMEEGTTPKETQQEMEGRKRVEDMFFDNLKPKAEQTDVPNGVKLEESRDEKDTLSKVKTEAQENKSAEDTTVKQDDDDDDSDDMREIRTEEKETKLAARPKRHGVVKKEKDASSQASGSSRSSRTRTRGSK